MLPKAFASFKLDPGLSDLQRRTVQNMLKKSSTQTLEPWLLDLDVPGQPPSRRCCSGARIEEVVSPCDLAHIVSTGLLYTSMYMYTQIHMYMYMYMRMHVHIYIYIHIHIHIHIYMSIYIHVCAYMCIYTSVHMLYVYTYTYKTINLHYMRAYINASAYMHVCT